MQNCPPLQHGCLNATRRTSQDSEHDLTASTRAGLIPHLVGSIAQLVEQGIENPCVPGSIPGRATTNTKASEAIAFEAF
tara:strand:+ start:1434 stop:1670 length:237 start_codon:yes stop_codon:yes gene_type:complete